MYCNIVCLVPGSKDSVITLDKYLNSHLIFLILMHGCTLWSIFSKSWGRSKFFGWWDRFAYVVNNYKLGFVKIGFVLVHIDKNKLYMWRFLMFNIHKNYNKYMAQSYLTEYTPMNVVLISFLISGLNLIFCKCCLI